MNKRLTHYNGTLMYASGRGLFVHTGGTKACDNREGERMTHEREKVTCPRCLKKLERHDAYEKQPQPQVARDARALLNESNELLRKAEISALAEEHSQRSSREH